MTLTASAEPLEVEYGVIGFEFLLPVLDQKNAIYQLTIAEKVTLCFKFYDNTFKTFECEILEPRSSAIVRYVTKTGDMEAAAGPFKVKPYAHMADGGYFPGVEFEGTLKRAFCPSS